MNKRLFFRLLSALLLTAVLLSSCGKAGNPFPGSVDDTVVMTVGSFDVTADEYNYFWRNARHDLDQGLESYWAEHPGAEEELRGTVEQMLRRRYAAETLAKECGVTLGSDEIAAVAEEVKAAASYYGDSFKSVLESENMTGDLFWSLMLEDALDEKLREVYIAEGSGYIMVDDASVERDLPENFVRVCQILIQNENGDDVLANLALAEELRARAVSGEDFVSLVKQYGEDNAQNPETGRYFTRGEMLSEFEDAAFALAVGGISEVVQTEVGYHVILRLPLDDDYINRHFEDFRETIKNRLYNEKIAEVASSLKVERTADFQG